MKTKLEWKKLPSVMTGGKPYFFNAWPNGVGSPPKFTVVWARVCQCWWAKINDSALKSFQALEEAKQYLQELESGRQSGLLHENTDPLCRDNIRKAGLPHFGPLQEAYWKGYLLGVEQMTGAHRA